MWGLKKEEILTIGDQNNDIELLKAGGIKIAMGNATEAAKAAAKTITESCADNGIVKELERDDNEDDEHDEHDEHHHEHHHEHEEEHCCCGHHDHDHHHADEVFVSYGFEIVNSYSKEELEEILSAFQNEEKYGIVLRAKGILRASDNENWYYFDYVSGEYEIRLGTPDYTGRICVIGSKIDEHKIEELFYKRG